MTKRIASGASAALLLVSACSSEAPHQVQKRDPLAPSNSQAGEGEDGDGLDALAEGVGNGPGVNSTGVPSAAPSTPSAVPAASAADATASNNASNNASNTTEPEPVGFPTAPAPKDVPPEKPGSGTPPPVDPKGFAKALDGWRWVLPCADQGARDVCAWNASAVSGDPVQVPGFQLARQRKVKFGGDTTVTYQVKVRIRGLAEPKTFDGGQVLGEFLIKDGTPQKNDYNRYTIEVAEPKAVFTVNRSSKPTGHYTMLLDYEATIPVRGGSEVVFGIYDPNTQAIANPGGGGQPKSVPGLEPTIFFGQLIQLDVLEVK